MDYFLAKVSQQAVSFAIRTGILVTSQFALKQCNHYISTLKHADTRLLRQLSSRLATKIKIISPAIDLVEVISARGNTSLESALALTKSLRSEIQELGLQVESLLESAPSKRRTEEEVQGVVRAMKDLLARIEEAVPFISLAVATSGVRINSGLPQGVSPSRLLQASTLLTAGDTAYAMNPFVPAQIGNTFTLSLYMMFHAHTHRAEISAADLTWQEVICKCRAKLQRVPLFYDADADGDRGMRAARKQEEYAYELVLIEDLDDGRVHDEPGAPFEDVKHAGKIVRIPVHQVAKMFYTTSGKLLGIEESTSPVLLLKRNRDAQPPRRILERVHQYECEAEFDDDPLQLEDPSFHPDADPSRHPDEFGLHLDPNWLAFQVYSDDPDEPEDVASSASPPSSPPTSSPALPDITSLSLTPHAPPVSTAERVPPHTGNLSILECLLRLTTLQNFQQCNHLLVHDELLNLFLTDEVQNATGAPPAEVEERTHASDDGSERVVKRLTAPERRARLRLEEPTTPAPAASVSPTAERVRRRDRETTVEITRSSPRDGRDPGRRRSALQSPENARDATSPASSDTRGSSARSEDAPRRGYRARTETPEKRADGARERVRERIQRVREVRETREVREEWTPERQLFGDLEG